MSSSVPVIDCEGRTGVSLRRDIAMFYVGMPYAIGLSCPYSPQPLRKLNRNDMFKLHSSHESVPQSAHFHKKTQPLSVKGLSFFL